MRYIFDNSYLEKDDDIEYLHIKVKSYYQSGYASGKLFEQSKNKVLKLLKNPVIGSLLSIFYWFFKRDLRRIRIPKDYLDELKGYSDSTKIPYHRLFLINFIFDVLKKLGFHCSSFVFFGSDNSSFIGRNTDLRPLLARIAVRFCPPTVITLNLEGKNIFTHVTLPFFVGAMNGINEAGLAVNSHQMLYVKEKNIAGNCATPLLVRLILEHARNLTDASEIGKNNMTARSLNLLVSDIAHKESCIFEIAPDKFNIINKGNKNYLACTTHFQSEKMNGYHYHSVEPSVSRLVSINNYLTAKKNISLDDLLEFLKDTTNGLVNDGSGYSITNSGTFQSFIIDFNNQNLHINIGRKIPVTHYGQYLKIKLWTGEKS